MTSASQLESLYKIKCYLKINTCRGDTLISSENHTGFIKEVIESEGQGNVLLNSSQTLIYLYCCCDGKVKKVCALAKCGIFCKRMLAGLQLGKLAYAIRLV